jgi:flagella basal body P-ring formation protein FlgA
MADPETIKYASRRGMRRWLLALLFLPAPFAAASAGALHVSVEPPLAIIHTARVFIARQIAQEFPNHRIEINNLDPRLALPACDTQLQGFLPPGGHLLGNTVIGVRCMSGKPWTIYVPAKVIGVRQIVVTKRPVLRGSAIAEGDIALTEREITGDGDAYIFEPEHVLGKIAKQPLRADIPLTPDLLDAPLLVRRGQEIIILAQGDGIEVRMSGTALMDGAEGQLVRVRNTLSNRTVEGLVIKTGIIKVNM